MLQEAFQGYSIFREIPTSLDRLRRKRDKGRSPAEKNKKKRKVSNVDTQVVTCDGLGYSARARAPRATYRCDRIENRRVLDARPPSFGRWATRDHFNSSTHSTTHQRNIPRRSPLPFATRWTLSKTRSPSWRALIGCDVIAGRVRCGVGGVGRSPAQLHLAALSALEVRRPYDRRRRTERDEWDERCGKFSCEERIYGSGAAALFTLRSPCLLQRGSVNIRTEEKTDFSLGTQEAEERYLFRGSHGRPMTKSDGLSLRRAGYSSPRG